MYDNEKYCIWSEASQLESEQTWPVFLFICNFLPMQHLLLLGLFKACGDSLFNQSSPIIHSITNKSQSAGKMMKIVLLLALVALAYSYPQGEVSVLRSDFDDQGDGKFSWAFETSDGTKADQQGEPKNGPLEDGTNGAFETVRGSYSYVSPEGKNVLVTYEADEKGYRPKTTIQ